MSQLDKIKKETGFNIPKDYFDNFSEKMDRKINEKDNSNGVVRFLKPLLSAAAIIAGISIISYYAYNINTTEPKNQTAEIITQEEYEESLYSEEFIIDALAEELNTTDTIEIDDGVMEYLEDEVSYDDLLAEL